MNAFSLRLHSEVKPYLLGVFCCFAVSEMIFLFLGYSSFNIFQFDAAY